MSEDLLLHPEKVRPSGEPGRSHIHTVRIKPWTPLLTMRGHQRLRSIRHDQGDGLVRTCPTPRPPRGADEVLADAGPHTNTGNKQCGQRCAHCDPRH